MQLQIRLDFLFPGNWLQWEITATIRTNSVSYTCTHTHIMTVYRPLRYNQTEPEKLVNNYNYIILIKYVGIT